MKNGIHLKIHRLSSSARKWKPLLFLFHYYFWSLCPTRWQNKWFFSTHILPPRHCINTAVGRGGDGGGCRAGGGKNLPKRVLYFMQWSPNSAPEYAGKVKYSLCSERGDYYLSTVGFLLQQPFPVNYPLTRPFNCLTVFKSWVSTSCSLMFYFNILLACSVVNTSKNLALQIL